MLGCETVRGHPVSLSLQGRTRREPSNEDGAPGADGRVGPLGGSCVCLSSV